MPKQDNKDPQEKKKQRGSPRDLLRLMVYAKPYRLRLTIALASLFIGNLIGLAFPKLVQYLIDAAFIDRDYAKLNRIGLVIMASFAVQAIFGFARAYLFAFVSERILADIRTQIYNHLIHLPLTFFDNRRTGELVSRVSSDVTVIQTATTTSLSELLRQTLILVGGIAIIAITNPKLTAVMLAIIPVVVLLTVFYGRYVRRMSTKVQDKLADANSVLEETLAAIRIVQSFAREAYEQGRYRLKIMEALQTAMRRATATGGFIAFIIFVVYSAIATILWFGSRMVIAGEITAGELTAFVLYTFVVAFTIGGMAELYTQFQQAIGATRRVFEILDTRPAIQDTADAKSLALPEGRVELRDVRFTYADERNQEVLKGVSIEARAGEIIALVGPSGAGKSTLVSLVPRFYEVTAGALLVDGIDVRDIKVSDLREAIGMVPQETILFSGTVKENIAYGRLDATDEAIENAARAAHAHEFVSEFPEGYNTIVGERGVKLSGGQRQRIAIARALLKNPAILILDEATSSLDSESERLVQDALEHLMQGRTTFVIAHRLSTVRRADRIIVLNEGRIVEEGTHEALLASGGLYKQLHDIQFRDMPTQEKAISEL
ncbi:MAG: ABC transporter transmembrane domain-containing protein [Acidobacteriota bacterium]